MNNWFLFIFYWSHGAEIGPLTIIITCCDQVFHNYPKQRILTCDAFLLFKAYFSQREWILIYVKIYKEEYNGTLIIASVAVELKATEDKDMFVDVLPSGKPAVSLFYVLIQLVDFIACILRWHRRLYRKGKVKILNSNHLSWEQPAKYYF